MIKLSTYPTINFLTVADRSSGGKYMACSCQCRWSSASSFIAAPVGAACQPIE